MPKRDVMDFISHWSAASPSERAKPADVAEILETLVTMGRAREKNGKFSQ